MYPYLALARAAILESFGHPAPDREAFIRAHPEMARPGAVFVTLNKRGMLRGCIGSLVAHRTLADDIVHNAKAAAFHDPRFPPLTAADYDGLEVEVSVLSEPRPLPYADINELRARIRPGIDGVILRHGAYQATFLPQVWEQLPEFESFFGHLCRKAGLPEGCLQLHPDILTYQVDKIA